jgi:hypothetical protein
MLYETESPAPANVVLTREDAHFLAVRLRRLCAHHGYQLPKFAADDASLINIAGTVIGALLTNLTHSVKVLPPGLTDDERLHIHSAIDMLGDYEATAREHGNDSIAAGASATRHMLEKLFRFLPERIARGVAVPAPTRWCPECRSAGVVGIEQDVCPTCDGTGKVAARGAKVWPPTGQWEHDCPQSTGKVLLRDEQACTNCGAAAGVLGTVKENGNG